MPKMLIGVWCSGVVLLQLSVRMLTSRSARYRGVRHSNCGPVRVVGTMLLMLASRLTTGGAPRNSDGFALVQ